jgi:hypothetical protein
MIELPYRGVNEELQILCLKMMDVSEEELVSSAELIKICPFIGPFQIQERGKLKQDTGGTYHSQRVQSHTSHSSHGPVSTVVCGLVCCYNISVKMAVFWVVAPCSVVNFYQTTRRYNPEDSHLHSHRRENLKSYLTLALYTIQDEYFYREDGDRILLRKSCNQLQNYMV